MAIPFHKDITNLDGLNKSILNDRYVYRWFLYLLLQPSVKEAFLKGEHSPNLYTRLAETSRIQWLLGFFALLFVFVYTDAFNVVYLIAAGINTYFCWRFYILKRKVVAQMGLGLLDKDLGEDQVKKMSLYQMSEKLSKQYNVHSLVDAIYRLDKIYRVILFFSFLTVCYIIQIQPWWLRYSCLFVIYYVVMFLVNTSFFYRRIK